MLNSKIHQCDNPKIIVMLFRWSKSLGGRWRQKNSNSGWYRCPHLRIREGTFNTLLIGRATLREKARRSCACQNCFRPSIFASAKMRLCSIWRRRFPALQGAQVLFYPTAIGWHPDEKAQYGEAQHDAWQTIQRAHAIANGVYVAVVNRVGFEQGDVRGNKAQGKGLEFWGGSFVADPFGRVIAKGSHDEEEILMAEVDSRVLEDTRRHCPFLRARRIDAYAPITSRMID